MSTVLRPNALFDRASGNGALVHLFDMASLLQREPELQAVLGADVTFSDGSHKEADFIGLAGSRILGGEAKSRAADFTNARIQRDISLSKRIGASVHIMICLERISLGQFATAERLAQRADVALWVIEGPDGDIREGAPAPVLVRTLGPVAESG